jgi:hypothetical protein
MHGYLKGVDKTLCNDFERTNVGNIACNIWN